MIPFSLKDGVEWVGILDPNLRVFDVVMHTEYGTTYNSYVVKGEKIALIETVKERYSDQFLENLKYVVDPEEISYIIVNHSEPDHTGALAKVLEYTKNATVVGSKPAIQFLKDIVNKDFSAKVVSDGDVINLGGKKLRFIMAPFLHWADSMFTYLEEDKILFTCDAFGCHFCGSHILESKLEDFLEAQKYYFNVIMSPFSSYVIEAAEKIKDLEIEIIATGHGPILNHRPWMHVDRFRNWAKQELEKKRDNFILIGYVSAYGYTKMMAEAIAQGIIETGAFAVELVDVSQINTIDLVEKIEKSAGILVGSPTINRDALKPAWDMISSISVFKNKGKLAAAFGSYGWSGEAVKMMEDRLKALGLKTIEGLKLKFRPDQDKIKEAYEFGSKFAKTLLENK